MRLAGSWILFVVGVALVTVAAVTLSRVGKVDAANPPVPYVPTYSARFASDDGTGQAILAELKGIRAELKALRQSQSSEKQPASLQALLTLRCAKCHAESVADAKGGGVVLVLKDGTLPPFSTTEKRAILRVAVTHNDMPKGGPPLTEIEKLFLEQSLTNKE